jgi:transcription elongation factor GreA
VDQIIMTASERESIERELGQLETTGRREIAGRIKTAREWGDLKENAEYHAAK